MEALIEIDYTNDFVADKGALTAGQPAQKIEQELVSLVAAHQAKGDFIVLATDLHDKNDSYHPESQLFPPHNIDGTWGRQLYGELDNWYTQQMTNPQVCWLDKTRYSAFAGTDLDLKLRERQITQVNLVGVCTDICVFHTAVDAYNLGYQIKVYQNAVASFDSQGHEYALRHFKNCLGAIVE